MMIMRGRQNFIIHVYQPGFVDVKDWILLLNLLLEHKKILIVRILIPKPSGLINIWLMQILILIAIKEVGAKLVFQQMLVISVWIY